MSSYQITIPPSRRAAARFVSDTRRGLQKAFVLEKEKRGLTQSEIARLIGVHRSVINRELRGQKDIGLGRVGELAWALGRRATLSFPEIEKVDGQNEQEEVPKAPIKFEVSSQGAVSASVSSASNPRTEFKFELV